VTLWVGGLCRAYQVQVAGNQGVYPGCSLYRAAPATFVWESMATPFLPLCLSVCRIGSHTDIIVTTSGVVANATCKVLLLNVGPVVWCHALQGLFCALVRVPAVAHTHPAGAL
jgi:hypothetical protein